MKTRIGPRFGESKEYATITTALKNVPADGSGYVWVLFNNIWHLPANYADGKVWNGSTAQIVPGNVEDISYLARHSI
jgi:hypothetical protein